MTADRVIGSHHSRPEQGLEVHEGLFVHGSLYDRSVICLRPDEPGDILHVRTDVSGCPLGM